MDWEAKRRSLDWSLLDSTERDALIYGAVASGPLVSTKQAMSMLEMVVWLTHRRDATKQTELLQAYRSTGVYHLRHVSEVGLEQKLSQLKKDPLHQHLLHAFPSFLEYGVDLH